MNKQEWVEKCQHWKNLWDEYRNYTGFNPVNLYSVIEKFNLYSDPNDIFMCDAGSMSYICPVVLKIKGNQKLISSPAQADMGWVLPASIGVSLNTNRRIIVFVGDGSFMSNLQELAVVKYHNLNIKFIVLNNDGYLSIKNTQTKFFEGRVFGTGHNNGLWFPKFSDIASSFGLKYDIINNTNELDEKVYSLLQTSNCRQASIIECLCDPEQEIVPAQAIKNGKQCGLHDMYPFLPNDEIEKEMVISL